jgi:hypothetical protein
LRSQYSLIWSSPFAESKDSLPWSKNVPLFYLFVQLNPVHNLAHQLFKIQFNIFLFTPRSFQVASSFPNFVLKCCMSFHCRHVCKLHNKKSGIMIFYWSSLIESKIVFYTLLFQNTVLYLNGRRIKVWE